MLDVDSYALTDARVLQVAIELAPELFAALSIAKQLEDSRFPLESDTDLESILAAVGDEKGVFESTSIRITTGEAKDRFPNEFLPVTDRFDLIRKTYMAIVIAHETDSRARLKAVRADKKSLGASHPLNLELL